jgi:hypothetical protein
MKLAVRNHPVEPTLALTAAGVLVLVLGGLRRSRIWSVLGLLAAASGGVLYARAKFLERSDRIDEAESRIHSELDELDPVARAQVLADIAKSQL